MVEINVATRINNGKRFGLVSPQELFEYFSALKGSEIDIESRVSQVSKEHEKELAP